MSRPYKYALCPNILTISNPETGILKDYYCQKIDCSPTCRKLYWNKAYQRKALKLKESRAWTVNKTNELKRAKIIEILSKNPCVDCGESNVLCLHFHHKNPSDKIGEVAQLLKKRLCWQKIEDEINKCEVICANCHMKRTAQQFQWWKLRYVTDADKDI